MPSESGEIRIDHPDLVEDAELIAATLDRRGTATFHYGAFGTGWRMTAINQQIVQGRMTDTGAIFAAGVEGRAREHAAQTGAIYGRRIDGLTEDNGRRIDGLTEDNDRYTLWLRERESNQHGGPWLMQGGLHTPDYLAAKFGTNVLDGFGIAVLLDLIENTRADRPLQASIERITNWVRAYEIHRQGEDLPTFLTNPDQGGTE